MLFEITGNPDGPALICVPGLLGGPEDFRNMLDAWTEKFCIIILDPNAERREEGLNLSEASMKEVSFDTSAYEIRNALVEHLPNRPYYFFGISLGGKIVYDFALRFPEDFSGGVITDVGPGSFEDAELFQNVERDILATSLEKPWAEVRQDLRARITDRNLRVFIQSQIFYPKGQNTGIWKTGMENFKELLQRQSIDDQFENFEKVAPQLSNENRFITVLHSDQNSGISAATLKKMQQLPCLKIKTLSNTTHFMHVTHKSEIESAVLNMLNQRTGK